MTDPNERTATARRNFAPVVTPCPLTALPFIADLKTTPRRKRRSFWHVEPSGDREADDLVGMQFACDFLQYLKQNRGAGPLPLLLHIVGAMPRRADGLPADSIAAGFLGLLEDVLCEISGLFNFQEFAEQQVARQRAMVAAAEQRELEARESRRRSPVVPAGGRGAQ